MRGWIIMINVYLKGAGPAGSGHIFFLSDLLPQLQILRNTDSQGGRGHFTYLLEGQIHFALKLSVTCLI